MKKFIKFLAAAMMIGALSACGEKDPEPTPGPTPGPSVTPVEIVPDDIQVVDSTQSSGYEKYRGEQTVKELALNLQDVLVQNQYSPAVKVMQFKATIGTLTITNSKGFKSVTIKCLDSFDFGGGLSVNDQAPDKATVQAGAQATDYKSGSYDVSEYSYTITLASAPASIVLKNVNMKSDGSAGSALRVTSITLA